MGMFDSMTCRDPRFVCSEGHALVDEEFQTKDLGCTLGQGLIDEAGAVTFRSGGWGDPPAMPLSATIDVYCDCRQCPAFVQARTHNLVAMWVEFAVTVVDGKVTEVRRTSATTAEQIAEMPSQSFMVGCTGPMSYDEADRLQVDRRRTERERT